MRVQHEVMVRFFHDDYDFRPLVKEVNTFLQNYAFPVDLLDFQHTNGGSEAVLMTFLVDDLFPRLKEYDDE